MIVDCVSELTDYFFNPFNYLIASDDMSTKRKLPSLSYGKKPQSKRQKIAQFKRKSITPLQHTQKQTINRCCYFCPFIDCLMNVNALMCRRGLVIGILKEDKTRHISDIVSPHDVLAPRQSHTDIDNGSMQSMNDCIIFQTDFVTDQTVIPVHKNPTAVVIEPSTNSMNLMKGGRTSSYSLIL